MVARVLIALIYLKKTSRHFWQTCSEIWGFMIKAHYLAMDISLCYHKSELHKLRYNIQPKVTRVILFTSEKVVAITRRGGVIYR